MDISVTMLCILTFYSHYQVIPSRGWAFLVITIMKHSSQVKQLFCHTSTMNKTYYTHSVEGLEDFGCYHLVSPILCDLYDPRSQNPSKQNNGETTANSHKTYFHACTGNSTTVEEIK